MVTPWADRTLGTPLLWYLRRSQKSLYHTSADGMVWDNRNSISKQPDYFLANPQSSNGSIYLLSYLNRGNARQKFTFYVFT